METLQGNKEISETTGVKRKREREKERLRVNKKSGRVERGMERLTTCYHNVNQNPVSMKSG